MVKRTLGVMGDEAEQAMQAKRLAKQIRAQVDGVDLGPVRSRLAEVAAAMEPIAQKHQIKGLRDAVKGSGALEAYEQSRTTSDHITEMLGGSATLSAGQIVPPLPGPTAWERQTARATQEAADNTATMAEAIKVLAEQAAGASAREEEMLKLTRRTVDLTTRTVNWAMFAGIVALVSALATVVGILVTIALT